MWIYLQNGWRPALEILILAVMIYYASRFLRGTRGWPVVVGFVVVLLVLALAAVGVVAWAATLAAIGHWRVVIAGLLALAALVLLGANIRDFFAKR